MNDNAVFPDCVSALLGNGQNNAPTRRGALRAPGEERHNKPVFSAWRPKAALTTMQTKPNTQEYLLSLIPYLLSFILIYTNSTTDTS